MWDAHLRRVKSAQYRTDQPLEDARPIRSMQYRVGPNKHEIEENKIGEITKLEVIKLTQTEWESPIVFVPKHGRYTLILCWLQRSPCRNCRRPLFRSRHGQERRILGGRDDLLDDGCKQWLLGSQGAKGDRENLFCVTSWIISALLYAVQIGKRTRSISASNGSHFFNGLVAVWDCLTCWYYDNISKIPEAYMKHMRRALRRLRGPVDIIKLKKCKLFSSNWVTSSIIASWLYYRTPCMLFAS